MPKEQWPATSPKFGQTEEEKRTHVLFHTAQPALFSWEDFSKWKVLLRRAAYVIRFPSNLRKKLMKKSIVTSPLTQEELKEAELFIIKLVQNTEFAVEIALLKKPNPVPWKNALPKSSSLYSLSTYLDEMGLLRMKGRIDAFVQRTIGFEKDVNSARTFKQDPMLRKCQPFRPHDFCRPFSYIGIDYFGPMNVVVGRRTEKRWGVLITCLTVRAIHLEVAHSLTTDSCILAIRNFIARRGAPLEIISDRGTNFVGASRELREALSQINQDKRMEHFVTTDTKWSFNPPASPHFGGAWERLVQSVEKALKQTQLTRTPTDELLRNMLAEVKMIVNSRSLNELPLDDELSQALTPNHFLLDSSDGTKPPIAFDDSSHALKHTWKSTLTDSGKDGFVQRCPLRKETSL
ncbi:uncharacterized protein LOC134290388 [Aedes albopictus]|uniref:Integrase catalytic domain-containing protein n=1 Tax=Aedes albopictus TaxID=7160 RepID=A0ABM1ZWZ8_AEDAL